ncbi:MAG: hypothetical protein EBS08_07990, partial [Cytophagia bacterium]|nr:hypothetical protein [Cytophagia bacterium]
IVGAILGGELQFQSCDFLVKPYVLFIKAHKPGDPMDTVLVLPCGFNLELVQPAVMVRNSRKGHPSPNGL